MKRIKKLIITIMTITVMLGQTNGYSASSGKDPATNFSAPGGPPANKSPLPGSVSWTEVQPAGNADKYWVCSSVSANGSKMLVGVGGGRLYLSYDYGNNWNETQPANDQDKDWMCVSVSGDGSVMIAGVYPGRLYISTDGGANWSETKPGGDDDMFWNSLSASYDGSTIMAVDVGENSLYLSKDKGVSWTTIAPELFKYYWYVSVSSDGKKLVATNDRQYINISTNAGYSWNWKNATGGYDWLWTAASISADGSTLIAATQNYSERNTVGRIFLSRDDGNTWSETQPVGDENRDWNSVALSGNGAFMLAGIYNGRLYLSKDGGGSWQETKPKGESDGYWKTLSVSVDGRTMLAGDFTGRLYKGTLAGPPDVEFSGTPFFSSTTVNSSNATGKIVSTNGANASHRGGIVYEYTGTDKITGDAGVTQVDSTGNFGTGEFPVSFTGLSANTRYNARVYATNSNGTGYSDREDFWTLANVPGVPTLISASATSLSLVLNTNNNPAATEFAIQDSIAGTYVQANGTRAATAVWQTAENWDTVTITGLTPGSTYYFRVKTKNGDGVETAFGISASGISMTTPAVKYPISGGQWEETMPAGNVDKNWISVRYSSDGSTILAGVYGGRLYISTNEGVSWQETRPAGNTNKQWYTLSVSADGNNMLAGVEGGRLYKSTDAGNTWSEIQPAGNNNFDWQSVSISGDGTRILAGITLGRLYFSSNSGTSWNELQLAGNTNMGWPTVSISNDGNTMLAGAYMYKLYKSTNGGVNWSETQPAGNTNTYWYTTCIANNGSLMLAGVYNGRLYKSTNAGTSWSETQPAGNVNKSWVSSSVSTDGSHLLAGASVGRLYKSTDGGSSWSETQPAGNSDKRWVTSTITSDGGNMVAGVFGGRLYRWVNEYVTVTAIAETSATGNGKIFSLQGGGNATNRGVIYYPYINSEKIIGDADVTNVSENGSFGIGDFTESLTGLAVNSRYNMRAHATNGAGTGYGTRGDFWTLANVPAAPILSNHSPTSLLLYLSTNGNPAATEFAIQDSIAGTYVQADGTRAATAVWQTAANWDTVTITGLTSGTACYFRAKAKNGNAVETVFGVSASGTPIAAPTVEFPSVISWSETQPAGNADKLWATSSISEDGNRILAGINYGRLYLSTNGGTSWGETQPAGNADKYWQSSSVSADGNTMLAGVYAGRLYLSNNGGTSWSETQPAGNADKVWSISSISADVSKILAGVDAGRLYLSSNGGTSWSEVQPAGNVNSRWVAGSVSNDGNTMLAGVYNGRLYKSTNGGLSWSETRPAGDSIRYWQTVSISADGKIMLAGINNGRLYLSTNKGTSWTETRPAGNENKNWGRTAVSADGSRMLAGVATGRLYMSTNGGISWNETQPAGNIDKFWVQVNISSDSKKMLACVMGGRLYSGNLPLTISDLTTTSATATGYISSINCDTATNRGIIHYPYTNTNKIIGDASVTNISENGSFGIGNFTASLTGLSVNTHYNLRAHATNTVGTGYSDRSDFWTLANPPEAPIIDSVGATTVYLTFGTNSNPASTEFAVRAQFEEDVKTPVTTKYVNATTGALQDTADWQTGTTWETNNAVTGLETGFRYIFNVKARNGANVETYFSDTASAVPASKPVVCAFGNSFWKETQPAGNSNKNWQTVSVSADGMTMLAGDFIGRLYLSKDKGNTWSEIQPAGDNDLLWVKVSVSGDGSTLLAGIQGGRLYLSTDGGITWSETQPAGNINADWFSLASSTDGSTIMAGISATRLYFSSNRGSSWTEVQPGGDYDYDWRSVSVSGNGTKILAAAKNNRLYLSTDHCMSWNEVQPAGDVDKKWQTVSISTDGNVLIAGANTGRLYLSTDGGASWSEQQPAGDADKKWNAVSVSSDGAKMLAAVLQGRLYESVDTGATWNEIQPAGNADKQWTSVAVSANSRLSLAGIIFERMFVFDFLGVDNITVNSSSGQGNIYSTEGASITNRGFICYPYIGSNKEIGDAGVINTDENGTFGTGNFTLDLIDLSANAHYNMRSHSTNYKGTGYSDRKDFWTLANVPAALVIDSVGASTLFMTPDTSNNPAITEYAIRAQFEEDVKTPVTTKYVNATSGALQDDADWQTGTTWGTNIAATGLETGLRYIFSVKARNGAYLETAFSDTASAIPAAIPDALWIAAEPLWKYTGLTSFFFWSLAASGDALTMLAAEQMGKVYLTNNGGLSWIETKPNGSPSGFWNGVSVSDNGMKMIAGSMSQLYYSTNAGTAWNIITPPGVSNGTWEKIRISGDGSTILAAGGSRLWVTTNGGLSWSETRPNASLSNNFSAVALSSDGKKMLASVLPGRLYFSENTGTTWVEIQPAGPADQTWMAVAVSGDGHDLYAAVLGSRMYTSTDGGDTWNEIRPAGNINKMWDNLGISYSGNVVFATALNHLFKSYDYGLTWTETVLNGSNNSWGTKMSLSSNGKSLLCSNSGKVYKGKIVIFNPVTTTSASANAKILSTNGADAIIRGAIYYDYDNTNKVIGDAGVINVDSTGVFDVGDYPVSFAGLAVNAHYNARAHATNYKGTGYSPRDDFWTLANVPGAPTLNNVTANSVDVTLDVNDNPTYTEFAIRVMYEIDGKSNVITKYVNGATGMLQDSIYWQTDNDWDTTTISNLLTGQEYFVAVKARNGDQVETIFGDSASAITCSNPTNAGVIGSHQIIEFLTLPQLLTSSSGATDYGGTLEYKWQSSPESDSTGFADIANTNHDTYQPEVLSDTTWFRRVARVDCRPDWNDAVYSNVVKVTVVFRQHILIPQGWSYISSYLDPHNPDVVSMFDSIVGANHLSILTGIQGIYAPPPLYINTFGNWDVLKGYKVSMRQQDELVITGDTLINKTVDFAAGVHIIPVLTNQNTDITDVFIDPASDILYMLDIYSNLVYWPSGRIFTLSELIPGRGYLANFKNPVTLSYPPLSVARKATAIQPHPADGPWACNRSSNVHLISVSSDALKDLNGADFIGTFDHLGNCTGYAPIRITGQNQLLTVYGDDLFTPDIDGMTEYETLRFKTYRSDENIEQEFTAIFNNIFPNADGLYYSNGLSGIAEFKESATGIGEGNTNYAILVFPNPARDELNITIPQTPSGFSFPDSGIKAVLVSGEGKTVKSLDLVSTQNKIDVSNINPGIYLLRIYFDENLIVKRIVIH